MMKITLSLLSLLLAQNLFAGTSKITPEDKAKLARFVGEPVYVECKKLGPFSTNCQVDCGNGQRFRKASGYCYYMRQGTFVLNVSTRDRNKDIFHTAIVTVNEKTGYTPRNVDSNKINSIQVSSNRTYPSGAGPQRTAADVAVPVITPNPTGSLNSGINSQTVNNQISSNVQAVTTGTMSTEAQVQFSENLQQGTQNLNSIASQNSSSQLNSNTASNTLSPINSSFTNNNGISNQNNNANQVVLH